MEKRHYMLLSLPVIVGALGYFVDVYDLLLFSIIRVPSLKNLGLSPEEVDAQGVHIISIQMIGLLLGGIIWGVLGDKLGRLRVLFASIILYSLGSIANGFVHTVDQYTWARFITGLGLAGELGAGITLVSEIMPKEKRGIATSLVAGIGLSGAVLAYFIRVWFVSADGEGWRICYYIGGGLGLVLLLLRIGVLESGMYKTVASTKVSRGNFFMLFTNGKRFKKYMTSILIALPNWFVIGILLTFSNKFALKMNVQGTIDPGKAVMIAYIFVSIGDILIGFVSQWMKSRKNALWLFHAITAGAVIWYFNLQGQTSSMLYVVCIFLGFGTGFWAMFVTMAAEQFGTNIRATVATTVPNMARGSLYFVTLLFAWIQTKLPPDQAFFKAGWITGIVIFVIASISLALSDETFGKDLDYIEQ
jgi:putative MFS transporter